MITKKNGGEAEFNIPLQKNKLSYIMQVQYILNGGYMETSLIILGLFIIFILMVLFSSVKILMEYERAVVLRLGRFAGVRGPGLILLIPFIETMKRVNTQLMVMDVPSQDIITKDNISVKVNAVVYFKVISPDKAVLVVENVGEAISLISQTTLRSIVGQFELDDLLSSREKINKEIQSIIDTQTDSWGVKISSVELKHIDLPVEMQKAMSRQAESERERRAKVILAEGEYQAAEKLAEASRIIGENPVTLQLRYLQTLSEITSKDNNKSTIIPIPIDLIKSVLGK